jgi:hypothetical protein
VRCAKGELVKSLAVVNQLGAQYDKETPLLAEALQLASAGAKEDLNFADDLVCSVGADPSKDATCYLVQDLADAPGAAAYHDRDPITNKPRMFLAYSAAVNGEWFYDSSGGGDSYVELGLHELFETDFDPLANAFFAGNWTHNGVLYTLRAAEVCDPTQGQSETFKLKDGTVCGLPNYVLPYAYFGPAPPGSRFDRMGLLKNAGDIAPEGYQIAAGITSEKDVFAHVVTGGSMKPGVLARKKAPGSRAMQRLTQIAAVLGVTDPSKLGWV